MYSSLAAVGYKKCDTCSILRWFLLMRKILTLALASTFLTVASPTFVSSQVQAKSLFESLFPRTAKRRKERRLRKQQRRQRLWEQQERQRQQALKRERLKQKKVTKKRRVAAKPAKPAKIESVGFKTYFPRSIQSVKLASLSSAFTAYNAKLLAEEKAKLQETKLPNLESEQTSNPSHVVLASSTPIVVEPDTSSVGSVAVEPEVDAVKPVMYLSAGSQHLNKISLRAPKSLSKAVINHYKKSPEFLWIDADGQPTQKANELVSILENADAFGMTAAHYQVPDFAFDGAVDSDIMLQAAMEFEFALTVNALRYANDARHGLVDPNRVSGYHDFKGLQNNYTKSLANLSKAVEPKNVLLNSHPRDKAFEALRSELKDLRSAAQGYEAVNIKPGTFIRPGQTNDQVANIVESIRRKADADMLATHFDVFAVDHSEGLYDDGVVALVKDFQKSKKLKPDGIVGKNTISRMVGDNPAVKLNKVLYAMERLRWHPDRLGPNHVFINQPAYRATLYKGGVKKLSMRTVVGKVANQTNFFHDTIDYVEFNPYWGIPRSILVNEMLPKLRRNPSYLDNKGYEVTNTKGRRISSASVDWWSVGANFPYNVRQPPGPKNALGELKIMFPNKHSIYMHDTPAKSLFKRNQRAYSHGCVRLAEPRKMAAAVLGTSVDHVSSQIGQGKNKTQRLKSKVHVYVSYFTAWPNEAGKVEFFGDVYKRDNALGKALALENKARMPRA